MYLFIVHRIRDDLVLMFASVLGFMVFVRLFNYNLLLEK